MDDTIQRKQAGDEQVKINHEKALAALLTSSTQAEAAEKCGIAERTLRDYLRDPEFAEEYAKQRKELVTDATRKIQTKMHSAIDVLTEIMESKKRVTGARDKVAAAKALLDYGLRYTEATDITPRLERLWAEYVSNGKV